MSYIQVKNLSYTYPDQNIPVFKKHNLSLTIEDTQTYSLYGIIGPSGTGKTTLLSILGGQLHPQKGKILINQQNIYEIGDRERRQLLAVQMQTSSALRGSLKYNLIFGIPDSEHLYTDEYLQEVLKQVGLWNIFKDKDGLDTLIGEGGMNLSGGQRQRLNFAGLYLRAKHFKPNLILIDEPTSSLDEISEQAITAMIDELSGQAITFVVAHRLKTLDKAVGILDTSLITQNTQLEFYSQQKLIKVSQYYRDLRQGKAQLEE
jgi:ABC-type multidrug transport system fused ATPase/permease subunit